MTDQDQKYKEKVLTYLTNELSRLEAELAKAKAGSLEYSLLEVHLESVRKYLRMVGLL